MGKHKRASFRLAAEIPARFLPIEAAPQYLLSEETPLTEWYEGEITDLSISGVRLSAPLKIDAGSLIALHFTLPSAFLDEMVVSLEYEEHSPFGPRLRTIKQREENFKAMEICAKVIRVTEETLPRAYQYHVSFLNLSADEEQELTRFITLSQRYELKMRRNLQER